MKVPYKNKKGYYFNLEVEYTPYAESESHNGKEEQIKYT